MADANTIEETPAVKAARAIGTVSNDKDWQFAAKHWHRMPDDDENKRELLKLGEAAAKTSVSEIYSGYSNKVQLGEWFQSGSLQGQVVTISFDGKSAIVAWYKAGNYAQIYTTSKYNITDFGSWTKLLKRPF